MVFLKAFDTSAIAFLSFVATVDAFWRMPLPSRTGLARLDPIVYPGEVADHAHAIHGGGAFSSDVTGEELVDSSCTSAQVTQDKSAYWTPSLHFEYPNGTTVIVPQVGGMLAYYLLYSNNYDTSLGNITAFPDGFRMLAGDMSLRNFTGPVPDPPTWEWTADMQTQFSLSQKALGFNCLNYAADPEPTLYRHFMPNKTFLDTNCLDGLRLELMFPSCWNGIDLDSDNHRSHMAYPDYVMTGICPEGYDVKVPSLLYETIWDTYAFDGIEGQFVLSQGDPTGYGYHGDFMVGWDSSEFLQEAVDTCTNSSGQISDCPLFDIQSQADAALCTFEVPEDVAYDNVAGPREGLAVDVPIQSGPEPATAYPIVTLGPDGLVVIATADATTTESSSTVFTNSTAPTATPASPVSSGTGGSFILTMTGFSAPLVTGNPGRQRTAQPRFTNSTVTRTDDATPYAPTAASSSSSFDNASSAAPNTTTTITLYNSLTSTLLSASTVSTTTYTSSSSVIEVILLATSVTVTVTVSEDACGTATASSTVYPTTSTFSTLTISQSRTITATAIPTLPPPAFANSTIPTGTPDEAAAQGTAVSSVSGAVGLGSAAPTHHPWAAVVMSPDGQGGVSLHRSNSTVVRRSKRGWRSSRNL